MRQRFAAVNLDKEEIVYPEKYGLIGTFFSISSESCPESEKIVHFSDCWNDFTRTLSWLFSNSWMGDRVIMLGEKAFENDYYKEVLTSNGVKHNLIAELNEGIFYKKEIVSERYFVNDITEEYVDLSEYPYCIIPHLITVGNGLSSTDYNGPDKEYIGDWAFFNLKILSDIPKNYTKAEYYFHKEGGF